MQYLCEHIGVYIITTLGYTNLVQNLFIMTFQEYIFSLIIDYISVQNGTAVII